VAGVKEPNANDPDYERWLVQEAERIRSMSDKELEDLIAPVLDRPANEWTREQFEAELELDLRLGVRGQTRAEMERHPRTSPISIRMPWDLLERVREEARRRNTPYQRLIKDLVEAGLAANAQPLARLEISAELLRRVVDERAVIVEVRRASSV
jgi:predicted DNA binding CopG/RHH family protein